MARSSGAGTWSSASEAVRGELVGLAETARGDWTVSFMHVELGRIDRQTRKFAVAWASARVKSTGPEANKCYRCVRSDLLPMFPVAQTSPNGSCSDVFGGFDQDGIGWRCERDGQLGPDQDVPSDVKKYMKKVVRPVPRRRQTSAFCSPAFAQLASDAVIAKAETILKGLQNGQTEDVVKELDPKMAQVLSEEKLEAAWPGLIGQFGAYKSINERRDGQYQG